MRVPSRSSFSSLSHSPLSLVLAALFFVCFFSLLFSLFFSHCSLSSVAQHEFELELFQASHRREINRIQAALTASEQSRLSLLGENELLKAVQQSDTTEVQELRERIARLDNEKLTQNNRIQNIQNPPPTPLVPVPVPAPVSSSSSSFAVLLFTFNRASNLDRTLNSLFSHVPFSRDLPLFVSQDGDDSTVTAVLDRYSSRLTRLQYHFVPPSSEVELSRVHYESRFSVYYKISNHYKFALSNLFQNQQNFSHVIIVEDDFEVSPDFFDYFSSLSPLLNDPSVYCISAWNDNGREGMVNDPKQFYRSECFPGLGWMINRNRWNELGPKWPYGFWVIIHFLPPSKNVLLSFLVPC
jgi:hypothetical protein